jgi:hypothetical protein
MSTLGRIVPRTGAILASLARRMVPQLRFSLRDLFLVTLVCAALAAWGHGMLEKHRPLRPSHIADYFTTELQKDVIAARAKTGETGEAWSFAPAAPMDLKGVYQEEHCLNREWFCYDLRLPSEKFERFHDELIRRIGSHIRHGKTGEHVSTSEFEGQATIHLPDLFGDSTKYHCGNIHGTIRVYLTRVDAQHARLIAILNEHRVP